MIRRFISVIRDTPRGWLIPLAFAGAFHIVGSVCVFAIGRLGLIPSQFDRSGLGEFAADSFVYQQDIANLSDKLSRDGPGAWLLAVAPLHVKLYSLSHSIFGHWTAPNVLTVEPLNLVYYLAALFLVFKLSERLFGRLSAALATTIVALWPSFFLHTTQFLRDPLLNVAILLLVWAISGWLAENYSWRQSAMTIAPAVLAVLTIWIVRMAMWDIVRAVTALGLFLLVLRLVHERRWLRGNIINAIVLSGAILLIPLFEPLLGSMQRREVGGPQPTLAQASANLTPWERMSVRRHGFVVEFSSAGSNIDEGVQFKNKMDVVRYLPRAGAIGLFAPFPNMWFVKGSQVGSAGRLVAAFETSFTYVLELLALICLWQMRKNLTVWLLVGTLVFGVTALGLIVLNIGAFYRLRYPYWMLIVVLATGAVKTMRNHARVVPTAMRETSSFIEIQSFKSGILNH